jgi:hypothetical protein
MTVRTTARCCSRAARSLTMVTMLRAKSRTSTAPIRFLRTQARPVAAADAVPAVVAVGAAPAGREALAAIAVPADVAGGVVAAVVDVAPADRAAHRAAEIAKVASRHGSHVDKRKVPAQRRDFLLPGS